MKIRMAIQVSSGLLAAALSLGLAGCGGGDLALDDSSSEDISSQSSAITFSPLTLQNGWVGGSYGTAAAGYALTNGVVQFRGGIETSGWERSPFSEVSVGLRPRQSIKRQVGQIAGNVGGVTIYSTGSTIIYDEGGGANIANARAFTSLENYSYSLNSTGFTVLMLQNGWYNSGFGYNAAVKNDAGTIRFQGHIKTVGLDSVPFTLPTGLRPAADVYVPVELCAGEKGRLRIQPSGVVSVQAEDTFDHAQCGISLDGVTFALSTSGYTAATLLNGWVNAPLSTRNLRFKNDAGVIRLLGAVWNGTSEHIFTLPAGSRPANNVYVAVDLCDSHKGQLYIWPTGEVSVQGLNSFNDAQCFTSFDGISFAL